MRGQPERVENGHISIGPSPLVICTIGKPRLPPSLKNRRVLLTDNPTWDDCQQLLQVLFTTEECKWILSEAWKNVPGVDVRPTIQPHFIEEGFPLVRPKWDFERDEGRERL